MCSQTELKDLIMRFWYLPHMHKSLLQTSMLAFPAEQDASISVADPEGVRGFRPPRPIFIEYPMKIK